MNAIDVFHQTGDVVGASGIYICSVGERKGFIKGEKFPPCPATGEKTTWQHAIHAHKSGETVIEIGDFMSIGEDKCLKSGDIFSECG
jgi:hypothetical protein